MLAAAAAMPSAILFNNEHKQRIQRLAAASTRHAENIALQRAAAKVALEQSLRTPSPQVQPVVTEDPQDTWLKFQYKMFEGPIEAGPVEIRTIQNVVARHYGVSRLDMISARRTHDVVRPRQVAMYLAKKLTQRSMPEIGRKFGGRDHTTVLHAVRKFERLIAKDASIAATINALTVELS